jgi:hypothetical protein
VASSGTATGHFRDLHLDIQCGKPGDIGVDTVEIGLQVEQVHLHADAVDRHSALLEVLHHGIDCVGLRVDRFTPVVVVKQQRLRIGGICPTEDLLDIGSRLTREPDPGLVVPE